MGKIKLTAGSPEWGTRGKRYHHNKATCFGVEIPGERLSHGYAFGITRGKQDESPERGFMALLPKLVTLGVTCPVRGGRGDICWNRQVALNVRLANTFLPL